MYKSKGQELTKWVEDLFSSQERVQSSTTWNNLGFYLLNNEAGGITSVTGQDNSFSSPGYRNTKELYDSTGANAAREAAHAFRGVLTDPATKWFDIRFNDEDLSKDNESVNWLQSVTGTLYKKLNDSNFDVEMAESYLAYIAFGNAALLMEEIEGSFRFTALHVGSMAWTEGRDGIVEAVAYKFTLSAEQVMRRTEWAGKVSSDVMELAKKDPTARVEFAHIIKPRHPSQVKVGKTGLAPAESRPFESYIVQTESQTIIEETGYYELPIMVSRFSVAPGEVYGRGPGHLALPDIRTLNAVVEDELKIRRSMRLPVTFVAEGNLVEPESFLPGSMTTVNDPHGIVQFAPKAYAGAEVSIASLQENVRKAFMLDLLRLPPRTQTGEMTAFEVAQRVEEMSRVIGPILSRISQEILTKVVIRALRSTIRNGEHPEVPGMVSDKGLDVDVSYTNQIAQSQRMHEVTSIQNWLRTVAEMAQVNPTVLDVVDFDGAAQHIAKILGVTEIAIRDTKDVDALREQRAQQQQAMQGLEAAGAVADIASKVEQPK